MSTKKEQSNPMWGGHFDEAPDQLMAEINASIDVDKALYAQDISGSIAHAEMLAKQGIVSKKDVKAIISGLKRVQKEIEDGKMTYDARLEDIHMHVESALREMIGPVAGKLHTARSRNDQVATDFKLWVRDAIDILDKQAQSLQKALILQAEQHADSVMPGYTHLQTAQPVTFGHHVMAYVEMLGRDRGRLADCRARLNQCPLGSAALAGTSFPIDRKTTAKALGFDAPTNNSLDSVSDRDFVIEYAAALSILSVHLSRLAEEMVIWATQGFQFITLSDKFTTGSSIMPQKRNPDAAELIRAKTGRIIGALNGILIVMKGLPLAYSKDMQEDKEPAMQATHEMQRMLPVMTGMVQDMTVHTEAMRAAASGGYSTATDLADWLVRVLDIPFRDAHHITGKAVKLAETKGCRLDELSLDELQTAEARITKEIFSVLSVDASVASRTSHGGTAPTQVKKAIAAAKKAYL